MFGIPEKKNEQPGLPNRGNSQKGHFKLCAAVPAVALYTRTQHKTLKEEKRPHKRGEITDISISDMLREEP